MEWIQEELNKDIIIAELEIEDCINELYEKYKGVEFKINLMGYKAIGNNRITVEIKAEV